MTRRSDGPTGPTHGLILPRRRFLQFAAAGAAATASRARAMASFIGGSFGFE